MKSFFVFNANGTVAYSGVAMHDLPPGAQEVTEEQARSPLLWALRDGVLTAVPDPTVP